MIISKDKNGGDIMRATMHAGRIDSKGRAFSAKHNDRNFDLSHAENIHADKTSENLYWTWLDDENDEHMTFEDAEKRFYEEKLKDAYEAQQARYRSARQYKRMQTLDEWRKSKQHCPEEVFLQVGKTDDTIDAQLFSEIADEYLERLMAWSDEHGKPFTVLDVAIHVDEAVPQLHIRRVWTYEDKDGHLTTGQEKALEKAGISRPEPDKPNSARNNRKASFSALERQIWLDTLEDYGLEIDTTPQAPKKSMTKGEWLYQRQRELDEEEDKFYEERNKTNAELARKRGELRAYEQKLAKKEKALDVREDDLRRQAKDLSSKEQNVRETAHMTSETLSEARKNLEAIQTTLADAKAVKTESEAFWEKKYKRAATFMSNVHLDERTTALKSFETKEKFNHFGSEPPSASDMRTRTNRLMNNTEEIERKFNKCLPRRFDGLDF